MAELTFRSPGVGTREIDLSGPTAISPQGTPAGIIGTTQQGPAFVPQTVATWQDFVAIFGATDGEKQGPLAMYEWMKNARAGTFIRVLGVGTAAKRSKVATSDSDGNSIEAGGVINAGFTVGQRGVKGNGYLGNNPFAYSHAAGAPLGRTFFLGAFMSESNGSTFFSEAGIQEASVAATASITCGATEGATDEVKNADFVTITDAGGVVKVYQFLNEGGTVTDAAYIKVSDGSGDLNLATNTTIASKLKTAIEANQNITVTVGSTPNLNVLSLTQRSIGSSGNVTITKSTPGGSDLTLSGFSGGAGGSIPIIRGILMFPSGVLPSLSGSGYSDNAADTVVSTGGNTAGGFIGDVNISSTQAYDFTLLLNGHKDTEAYPTRITASLSPLSPSYLSNVLNTDPLKIQEAGHYLYNNYNVHPNLAVVTGSGLLAGGENFVQTGSNLEPIAFLMTSSIGRNTGTSAIPNYEGFQDRFRTGFSPWVTSQKYGSDWKNLFQIHSLDDGVNGSDTFKVQIENLKNGKLDGSYGQFDLLVKRIIPPLGTPASEDQAVETFNGVNLDPTSDNYVARRIGDYHIYYDFDKMAGNQRVVVDGTHPNVSKYIRVKMHNDVTNGNIANDALPIGYRGPYHLVTSGSKIFCPDNFALAPATGRGGDMGYYLTASVFHDLNEPPNPLRDNISIGVDPTREVNSRLPWGFQFETLNSATEPNRSTIVDPATKAFMKYYPHFATSNRNAWVGDNSGIVDSDGTVLDADRFNNNVFTMERIQIHTRSTGDVVDPAEWAYASYRRTGKLSSSLRKEDGTYDQGRFLNPSKDFSDPASTKFLKFTFPLQGGFDGVNIFDKQKSELSNLAAVREMEDENQGQADGPTVKTYMKAIDVMAEKSDVDIQILAIPGIRETKITNHALEKTEERFDAIYIMDIEERDNLNNVITSSIAGSISVGNTVDDFKSRVLDSSFGAAYFPDVLVTDPATSTNVRCAPSVAVVGAFGLNDKVAYPWFAPAGFTRGALERVIQATVNLSRGNLDSLYDADINPITKFPTSEGVVIFGQKTLLAAASSLDRVNVRRLLIDIRRKVRKIADTFLFEPNREDTLARFSAAVNPVLSRIQQQQGLDRFKVIIDTTTTTQADVENNTIRGKIFLQPTRAIEFISLDFVVTNNGTEI